MTKSVDSNKAMNHLTKSKGSLSMARIALNEGEYDNAVMSAVHSSINALDALTTLYLGKRGSGAHTDVLSLAKGIFTGLEYQELSKQFTSLLAMKNVSEYQPDLMSKGEAEKALKWAERIFGKVKEKLEKK